MLKTSHTQTPRTMAEGTWHHGCDPIERPEPRRQNWLAWIGFSGFVALAVLLLMAGRS